MRIDDKERYRLNLIKGLAIFFMLWGHCIQYLSIGGEHDFFENYVFKFIYSFHMPLFMLVSGYLFFYSFSKRDLKDLLKHRSQRLIQSIVFGTILVFLLTYFPDAIFKRDFGRVFDGSFLDHIDILWFLWSVLSSSLTVAIICKTVKSSVLQIVFLILGVIVVALFPNATYNVFMYPYFILGFYYAKYKNKVDKCLKFVKYLSLIIYPVMLAFYEKKHYIYTSGLFLEGSSLKESVKINLFRWAIGLVGSIFVILIIDLFYRLVTSHCRRRIITDALSKAGEKSLQIYVLSVPILSMYLSNFFPYFLELFGGKNVLLSNIFLFNHVFSFGVAILYAVGLYWLAKVFVK